MENLIWSLPKAELHVHIEGTLEPSMVMNLADRNKIDLTTPVTIPDFTCLQDFLDVYYSNTSVLLTEQDFYDLTWAYFKKCYAQNIVYAEIFFDPQSHTSRGVSFSDVVEGINRACEDARSDLGIDSKLIMCFLRHLGEEDAFNTLIESIPHRDLIFGVGLDSSEVGNPPEKFKRVFAKAEAEGYEIVAHAGEEGGPDYIWGAINDLGASRIDHGVQCEKDEMLMLYLKETQIPLTVCPLSNVKLKVFEVMKDHNLKKLLDAGILVTVNSDDPAYFGGYLNENFIECQQALNLSEEEILRLVLNSFEAAFLDEETKQHYFHLVQGTFDSSLD